MWMVELDIIDFVSMCVQLNCCVITPERGDPWLLVGVNAKCSATGRRELWAIDAWLLENPEDMLSCFPE